MRILSASLVSIAALGSAQKATFELSYPSPWGTGGPGWDEAYEKAREFVSKLTLLEKVNLTTGTGNQADLCTGNTGSVPRLNFRHLCLQDGPVGVRYTDLNSVFPAGISAAATWSRSLLRKRGEAIGQEFSGKGIDIHLGPVVGPLGRDPAGGRNFEAFGPDPYLSGVAVAETIIGAQSAGVIASVKHYILNEQEHFRSGISSNLDDRTMHEVYLWPFADAVRAGVGSVMCSYNQINNTYACENSYVLNKLLKNELGFQGFVVTDWGAHHTSVASALAGLDMSMPGEGFGAGKYGSYWGGALTEAVLSGAVPQWRLDDMVIRIMAAFYKVGRDTKQVDINYSSWTTETTGYRYWAAKQGNTTVNYHVDVQADHGELIREIGAKAAVLLKNVGRALPLVKPESIAVIGEDAQDNPDGPNGCVDRICNNGTLAMGWGSATAEYPYLISPAAALEKQAKADGTAFTNIKGNFDLDAAKAAASNASVAIVFANADSGEGYTTLDGNFGDRNNLTLWKGGDELIKAVSSVNPNTVVVIHSVGPVLIDHIKINPNVSAIVWAGLPGQESGNSLTDVLYGRVNPQGRTPFTWGKGAKDWGVSTLFNSTSSEPQQDFAEGLFIDYRYFDREEIEPSFEFGFGLSYTNFTYSNITATLSNSGLYKPAYGATSPAPTYGELDWDPKNAVTPEGFSKIPRFIYPYIDNPNIANTTERIPPGGHNASAQPILPAGGPSGGNPELYKTLYVISADITNSGEVPGTEIPQLYISHGGPADPKVVLRGFDEVYLGPGETKTVVFNATYRDLSSWSPEEEDWRVTSYPKTAYVGASSRDLRLEKILPLPRA
ncbi:glycoside hydrolase family 3 protein [Daldinia caldariorum]|uniref:glycoside hydrolase family 3 protein n=1 Tax=Daldinia caldariorum TaxID=326644 RepID=UPI002008D53E|nr:glycoside hydrolase family 3 protein [Daldinia caldariorum]KAI1469408.1 glycoside hydrolase family 3 protein [Daldinia caldariorum]